MFKGRSKLLFITAIASLAYAIYMISYIYGANAETKDAAEQLGTAIASALIMPHLIMMSLGAIFSWLGFFLKATWGALVGAILFLRWTLLYADLFYVFSAAANFRLHFFFKAKEN